MSDTLRFYETAVLLNYLVKEKEFNSYGLDQGLEAFEIGITSSEGSCTPDNLEFHQFTWVPGVSSDKDVSVNIAIVAEPTDQADEHGYYYYYLVQ